MRIYKVKTPAGERLVEANTRGQAINHCVSSDYSAEPVGASEMYALIQAGKKVETLAEKPLEQSLAAEPAKAAAPTPAPMSQAASPAQPWSPPAAATPNPVLAEQARVNPTAVAAAGVAPRTILPVPPANGGPVDWQAREQSNG